MTTDLTTGSALRIHRDRKTIQRAVSVDPHAWLAELPDLGLQDDDPTLAWWRSYWGRPTKDLVRYAGNSTLTVGELFSGAGGLMLGARQAAWELGLAVTSQFAADLDAEAVDIYARNHGTERPIARSVTELLDYKIKGRGEQARFKRPPVALPDDLLGYRGLERSAGTLDLLLAGPPCQGYSHLNNHTLHDDDRNALYLTAAAAAISLDAKHVVIENVLGVAKDPEGVVTQTIQLLRANDYDVAEPTVVRAADIGWPQRRKRLMLVASRVGKPVPLTSLVDAMRAEPAGVLPTIKDLIPRHGESYLAREVEIDEITRSRIDYLFNEKEHDLPLDQRPESHRGGTTYTSVYGRLHADKPAPTITTGFSTMGRGRFVHPTQRRTLNGLEAARLQGFPDDYNWHVNGHETPHWHKLTKWIGDAVPMPIGYLAALSVLLPTLADQSKSGRDKSPAD